MVLGCAGLLVVGRRARGEERRAAVEGQELLGLGCLRQDDEGSVLAKKGSVGRRRMRFKEDEGQAASGRACGQQRVAKRTWGAPAAAPLAGAQRAPCVSLVASPHGEAA